MNDKPIRTNEQLDLGLDGVEPMMAPRRRESRITRATWWFTQMRRLVGAAIDWDAPPQPRPEQTWLPNTHRQVRV